MIELRENRRVQIRFLLGAAGTGKTFQCLEEIRAELKRSPEGPPLLFIAPKQATFQIERQLLSDPELPGYTRLQILSFDRLADFVLETLGTPALQILSEEGRVMVLRALLTEKHTQLRLFRSTARLPGFAQQLSALLRELQQQRLSPDRLIQAAEDGRTPAALQNKLHDVALLLRAYREWLSANSLHDSEELLEIAAETLRTAVEDRKPRVEDSMPRGMQLWLDGFAEMTPQELNLLAAFAPLCERATLAFCLETEPREENNSWLSLWSVVAQTFRRCRAALEAVPGCEVTVRILERDAARGRFAASPMLAHLEANWARYSLSPQRGEGWGEGWKRRETLTASQTQGSITPHPHSLSPLRGEGSPAEPDVSAAAYETLRLVTCANPEAEAVLAAREILHFVREHNARFRDCAVLLRTLDGYHDTLRRVFTRYGIPFFLDRRESVTHHPLAELTRLALRTGAFGWRHDDWFGALKTGLVRGDEGLLDELENEVLAQGWAGAQWTKPFQRDKDRPNRFEPLRQVLVAPFERLAENVTGEITGAQLATALRALWLDLRIEETLQRWSEEARHFTPPVPSVHDTVWAQMNEWLDNVERAFSTQPLSVAAWLPVLEAGLAGLTVGMVPPALDQVLVGTIDRSRQPDLRLALVLGLNETIFPAPPPRAPILTEAERTLLADMLDSGAAVPAATVRQPSRLPHTAGFATGGTPVGLSQARTPAPLRSSLGIGARQRLAHERYYGYIACTRSRERLVLTCAVANSRGVALNPSPFLSHIEKLFPQLKEHPETFSTPDWREAEHASEIAAPLINGAHPQLAPLGDLPALAGVVARAEQVQLSARVTPLAREIVEWLYRQPFETSVSALEDFAACPFKFFVKHGLRVQERKEFEVDDRQKGIFQHEILSEFHQRATANGKRWRDWTPADAAKLLQRIGTEKLTRFENGLFDSDETRRFTAQMLLQNLERLVATLVAWMEHYQFDPCAVELAFGLENAELPGWTIDLGGGRALVLRGRIDRIDLHPLPGGDAALAVVVDYKSSSRKVDAQKLYNGLELQLLSYVGLLRQLEPAKQWPRLIPAGVFYVGLRGGCKGARSRDETFAGPDATRRKAFQHAGRFDQQWAAQLDSARRKEQFAFHVSSRNACEPAVFAELLADLEKHLRQFGNEILDGVVRVAPYRKGQETACSRCEFQAICRFDPWVEPFRSLKPLPKKTPVKPKAKKLRVDG